MSELFIYRTVRDKEIRRRIKVAIWAYAYEVENASVVSDHHFDAECRKINPAILTGRPELDKFFQTEFDPSTGSWIHQHPELGGVVRLYKQWYNG